MIVGGRCGGVPSNSVRASVDGGTSWLMVSPSSPWSARSHFALIPFGEILYIVGGFNDENGKCDACDKCDKCDKYDKCDK